MIEETKTGIKIWENLIGTHFVEIFLETIKKSLKFGFAQIYSKVFYATYFVILIIYRRYSKKEFIGNKLYHYLLWQYATGLIIKCNVINKT